MASCSRLERYSRLRPFLSVMTMFAMPELRDERLVDLVRLEDAVDWDGRRLERVEVE